MPRRAGEGKWKVPRVDDHHFLPAVWNRDEIGDRCAVASGPQHPADAFLILYGHPRVEIVVSEKTKRVQRMSFAGTSRRSEVRAPDCLPAPQPCERPLT